jgi:hypothetical protein
MGGFQGSGGRSKWKRPLGRPRSKREDKIKMDVQELGLADIDWINLALDRGMCRKLVHSVMNHHVQ